MPLGLWFRPSILSQISRGEMGSTGIEEVTIQTPDISEYLDFDLYDCAQWIDKKHPSTTYDDTIFGRWIGISQNIV